MTKLRVVPNDNSTVLRAEGASGRVASFELRWHANDSRQLSYGSGYCYYLIFLNY